MIEKLNKITYEKDEGGATWQEGRIIRIPAIKDFMFKNLFGVNGKEENLKGLLQAILKIKIENLEIQNPELPREYETSKLGVLDVRAKLQDGTIASIEMQVENEKNLDERITFYVCKLYINTIETGGKYENMPKTIAIAITNFSYFNRKEYHQIAHLTFEKCKDKNEIVEEILKKEEDTLATEKIEIHIIDLKKFKKIKEPKGELADWLHLILGNEEEIAMASKENDAIAKANEENKKLSKKKELQAMYDLSRQMYELDQKSKEARLAKEAEEHTAAEVKKYKEAIEKKYKETIAKKHKEAVAAIEKAKQKALTKGIEEGRTKGLEEGRTKGLEEGRTKGLEEGRTKGLEEGKLEIAKELLKIGMKIEDIEKTTKLTKEEIEKL